MLKYFQSDMKRLHGIYVTYQDKNRDANPFEVEQRNKVLAMLQEAYRLLQEEIREQTLQFKHGSFRPVSAAQDEANDPAAVNRTDGAMLHPATENAFDMQLFEISRLLDKLEKQFLNAEGDANESFLWQLGENMSHQYYLDQLDSIRPTWQMMLDLINVVLIMVFILGALLILRDKGVIVNFHEKWIE